MTLSIKIKLASGAKMPTKGTEGAAGWDLYVFNVEPSDHHFVGIVHTGVYLEIPKGYVGYIFERSSTYKKGTGLRNKVGVIDSDYRGEIILNMSHYPCFNGLQNGDRIAQLIIMPIPDVQFIQVDELSSTERGDGGHGSTGH